MCEENANVAGHEMPKCVNSTGHEAVYTFPSLFFSFFSTELIRARSSAMPLHSCIRVCDVLKEFSEGHKGVIVCHNARAKAYPSPDDQVCAYAFHPVVMTTWSVI